MAQEPKSDHARMCSAHLCGLSRPLCAHRITLVYITQGSNAAKSTQRARRVLAVHREWWNSGVSLIAQDWPTRTASSTHGWILLLVFRSPSAFEVTSVFITPRRSQKTQRNDQSFWPFNVRWLNRVDLDALSMPDTNPRSIYASNCSASFARGPSACRNHYWF